jgi:four helix bundle protein
MVAYLKATVSDQLSRSALSVGSNAGEARSAESRADFIHKLQVSLKEAREAFHCLSVIWECGAGDVSEVSWLRQECDELIAIMVASVRTAKSNGERLKMESGEKIG